MRFRKLPVEIDAIQFTGANHAEVAAFMGTDEPRGATGRNAWVIMTTVHGDTAVARPGDWIVPEPEPGRFYPVKPEIFAATYEPV